MQDDNIVIISCRILCWLYCLIDLLTLFSLHERVLLRCETKYQTPDKASNANRFFVIFTSILILLGITYSFWLKNFSSFSLN